MKLEGERQTNRADLIQIHIANIFACRNFFPFAEEIDPDREQQALVDMGVPREMFDALQGRHSWEIALEQTEEEKQHGIERCNNILRQLADKHSMPSDLRADLGFPLERT